MCIDSDIESRHGSFCIWIKITLYEHRCRNLPSTLSRGSIVSSPLKGGFSSAKKQKCDPNRETCPRFPWQPFTAETSVRWVASYDLMNNEPCRLPWCIFHTNLLLARVILRLLSRSQQGLHVSPAPRKRLFQLFARSLSEDAFTIF